MIKIDPTINLGEILTGIVFLAAVVTMFIRLESRVDQNSQEIKHVREIQTNDRVYFKEALDNIGDDVEYIRRRFDKG